MSVNKKGHESYILKWAKDLKHQVIQMLDKNIKRCYREGESSKTQVAKNAAMISNTSYGNEKIIKL